MQKGSKQILKHLRYGPALKARVFLLCLLTLFGSVGIASHVHEIASTVQAGLQAPSSVDGGLVKALKSDLSELIAKDCDLFHINSLAVFNGDVALDILSRLPVEGTTAQFSFDSISPELFPPARAPPSGTSLT